MGQMKTFKQFRAENNQENIQEIFGLGKLFKKKKNEGYLDMPHVNILKQDKIRKQFHQQTNANVPDDTVPHIRSYRASSKPFDDHYKGENNDPKVAEGAKKIESVIKKTKTPRNMYMYRGFDGEGDVQPGTEMTHHGITSYGSSPSFAKRFESKDIIKLKVPEGTRAAYIEHIAQQRHFKFPHKEMESLYNHGGEENWVLHPKSRIRITGTTVKRGVRHHDAELVHDGVDDNQ